MAISSTDNKKQYAGDGGTVEFDLPYKIFTEDDVAVYLYQVSTGIQDTLVKTTDYTVTAISGDFDQGARITTIVTYSNDYTITIVRLRSETQDVDLVQGGEIPADDLNDGLDNLVMQVQQVTEKLDRVPVFPESEPSSTDGTLPTIGDRANKILGFDSDGNFGTFDAEGSAITYNTIKTKFLKALDSESEIDATEDPIAVAAPTDTDHALNQDAADLLYATIAQGDKADTEQSLRTSETALTAWGGSVTDALVAGAIYTVTVSSAIATFAPTLSTVGTCHVFVSNPAVYTIANPSNASRYSRGSAGIDDLSEKAYVELVITRTGSDYLYSAIEMVAIT